MRLPKTLYFLYFNLTHIIIILLEIKRNFFDMAYLYFLG